VKVADLVRHRSLHRKRRIWIHHTRAWVDIAGKVYAADLFVSFYFNYESGVACIGVLEGHVAI
jgi:hypothetical protein